MTTIKAILTALSAAGILTKLLVALGLVASLLTAYGVWHHQIYTRGYDAAIAGIAAADERAVGRAKAARGKLLDCQQRNGTWDQPTGVCR